jgi:hypothetical protein
MRTPKFPERCALFLAGLGLLIPRSAVFAEPLDVGQRIVDVALDSGGVFHGRVVNAEGQPVPRADVRMARDGVPVVSTSTNDQGGFDVAALQGGVYQVQVADKSHVLRLWAAQTAPPQAVAGFTIATGPVARGQGCTTSSCTGPGGCGPCGGGGWGFLTNPWVIGAAVAAAIAIPLALNDDDDDDAS